MNKIIKRLSIINIFTNILSIMLIWFTNNLIILRICCFLWVLCSLITNIDDIKRINEGEFL